MPLPLKWLSLVFVLLIYLARIVELRSRRKVVSGRVAEKWTLRVFIFCGTLMLLGSVAEFLLGKPDWNWLCFALGVACAAGSIAIRRRAIAALGVYWSLHNEIRERHSFVQSGPFRWMRHPTYLSMILELLSGALILQARYSLLLVSLIFFPTLWARIHAEESALAAQLGAEYRAYQIRTPALVPYKRPKPSE